MEILLWKSKNQLRRKSENIRHPKNIDNIDLTLLFDTINTIIFFNLLFTAMHMM